MEEVAKDIAKTVSEKKGSSSVPRIDVLVLTHEHYDHVSGFHPSLALYDKFQFDRVWMAWTEDPEDGEAKKINAYLRMGMLAVKKAVEKMKKKAKEDKDAGFYKTQFKGDVLQLMRQRFNNTLEDLVNFNGNISVTKTSKSGIKYKDLHSVSIETMEAFDHIKTKLAKNKSAIEYFEPGTLVDKITELTGVRIFVLGPPRNKKINKDKPSTGKNKEVYFAMRSNAAMGFIKGVLSAEGIGFNNDDGRPFGKADGVDIAGSKKDSWLKEAYHNQPRWKKIDEEWLNTAGSLALQIDNDTNNTSLVLAFQLIGSKKVLLFPGDAQVGNWLSWHDYEWEVVNDGNKETVNATHLLKNTVFYKAGHHGSHNATLKDLGLELMVHDELVTFIPEKEKQYNGIPYEPLLNRIKEKTKGRTVISADLEHPAEDVIKKKPAGITTVAWNQFKKDLVIKREYVEYTVRN